MMMTSQILMEILARFLTPYYLTYFTLSAHVQSRVKLALPVSDVTSARRVMFRTRRVTRYLIFLD